MIFFFKKAQTQTKTKTLKLNRLVKHFYKRLKSLIIDLATQTLVRLCAGSKAEYLTLRAEVLGLIFSFRLNSRSAAKGRVMTPEQNGVMEMLFLQTSLVV